MLASWHCGGVGQQTVYSPTKPQQRVAGLCAMRMLIGYKWRGKEVEKHENHEKQHAKLRPADSAAHWMTGHRGGHRPHLAAQLLDQHKTCVKAVNESHKGTNRESVKGTNHIWLRPPKGQKSDQLEQQSCAAPVSTNH